MVERMAGVVPVSPHLEEPPETVEVHRVEAKLPEPVAPRVAEPPVAVPLPHTDPEPQQASLPAEPSELHHQPSAPPSASRKVEPSSASTRSRTPVEKNPPISIFAIDYDFETAETFFRGLSWQRHGPDQPIPDPARKEALALDALSVREYFQGMIPWAGRLEGHSEAAVADRMALLQAATVSALQKAKRGKRVRQQTVAEWFAALPWSRS